MADETKMLKFFQLRPNNPSWIWDINNKFAVDSLHKKGNNNGDFNPEPLIEKISGYKENQKKN